MGKSPCALITGPGGLDLFVLPRMLPLRSSLMLSSPRYSKQDGVLRNRSAMFQSLGTWLFLLLVTVGLAGCGSGGYAGGGITSLSSSSITIDAGQSFQFSVDAKAGLPVSWALSGANCSGAACGTVTPSDSDSAVYTAPASVTTPIKVTLNVSISGTSNSKTAQITVNPAPTVTGLQPSGTVGTAYSATLKGSGGTGTLTLSSSGTLPPGLTFNASTGLLSGTPTTAGTFTFTVQVKDQSDVPNTVSVQETIIISAAGTPLSIVSTTLPSGTVNAGYSTTLIAAGGTTPYTWSVVSGSLPNGLALSSSTGGIFGIPTTAGTSTFTVQVKDASGATATAQFSITITAASSTLTITTGTLPNGTVGVAYSATIGVSGGTSPYTCSLVSGSLPAGLSLANNCSVTGTPTTAGTSTIQVKAADSATPANTVTGPVSITISAGSGGGSLVITAPVSGVVGTPYTGTIGVSGGTAPYTCQITAGTLPAGLSISNCTITGTPTTAGTSTITVKATDSSSPSLTNTAPVAITIAPSGSGTLIIANPPTAYVGTPYTGTIGVSGGVAPYTCQITSGTLPAGLSINNCTITGTPTTAGTSTITVKATDSSNPAITTTGPATITVSTAGTLTIASPPNATVGTPYTGTIGVTGGTAPYTCQITSGTLPAGLTANNCTITGTPTTAGTSTVTVKVTDSSNPTLTKTGPITITVNNASPTTLTLTGTLPNAVVNVAYSHSLTASGGTQPYTFSISAGSLPTGLSIDASTGVISGTPTVVGAYSFTVKVTDTSSPQQSATLPVIMQVTYASGPNDSELKGPYAFLFQGYDDVLLGVLAYQTGSVGSFTADGAGLISKGEMDSNHQNSVATGNTVNSRTFIGSYTIGSDHRGLLTITNFNADGSLGDTETYSITLKAPVAPATVSTKADIIRFDNANLVGTRGSGTVLAQTTGDFTNGLKNNNYVFGMSGDSPCLPSCTIGIVAGPAAAVGEITIDATGQITSGLADANLATTKYASEVLTGNFGSADANGRLALSMQTTNTPANAYPSDYAVYMVDASHAFILSTDKHSDYVLLAGSMERRSQTTFSNASMNGAYVGYENSLTNPGLVGTLLQNLLNLSTATVFRGTSSGDGNCNITNVDVAGTTGLVSKLTGILGDITGLLNLLSSYDQTGATTCAVASNGRGTLAYPPRTLLGIPIGTAPDPRVFYLSSTGTGYFLETGYAGLGRIEAQTGAPFNNATLNGTYVYGTTTAASLASINAAGTLTADGAGHLTTVQDENVGVGNINLLQLGTTGSATYNINDVNAGRYTTNGTLVIYAISPGRFVVLDTSALVTSPSVSLVY